jgi:hypothetical protein
MQENADLTKDEARILIRGVYDILFACLFRLLA